MSQLIEHRPRLLVIDGSELVHRVFATRLGQDDYQLMVASDGEEGLRLARNGRPDVIVLEMELPDTDAYGVLRELQADARTASIPVIMTSTFSQPIDRVRALDEGAVDVVTKPCAMIELAARIRVALRWTRAPLCG